jgi:hypothetical protein
MSASLLGKIHELHGNFGAGFAGPDGASFGFDPIGGGGKLEPYGKGGVVGAEGGYSPEGEPAFADVEDDAAVADAEFDVGKIGELAAAMETAVWDATGRGSELTRFAHEHTGGKASEGTSLGLSGPRRNYTLGRKLFQLGITGVAASAEARATLLAFPIGGSLA